MTKKSEINEKYIYQLVSYNIKRLRDMQNISQLNLALKSGLTQNFINDIENCKKGISVRSLAKLSIALDAEPHQFYLSEKMLANEASIYLMDFSNLMHNAVNDIVKKYIK